MRTTRQRNLPLQPRRRRDVATRPSPASRIQVQDQLVERSMRRGSNVVSINLQPAFNLRARTSAYIVPYTVHRAWCMVPTSARTGTYKEHARRQPSGSISGGFFLKNRIEGRIHCQRGVYPPLLQTNGGIGKTRPREAPPRAPTGLNFNCGALARCPQPIPSTYVYLFLVFGHIIGAEGTDRAAGGVQTIPPF